MIYKGKFCLGFTDFPFTKVGFGSCRNRIHNIVLLCMYCVPAANIKTKKYTLFVSVRVCKSGRGEGGSNLDSSSDSNRCSLHSHPVGGVVA